MEQVFYTVARRFWPELKDMSWQKRLVGIGEVITFLYSAPLALAGLIWLIIVTDYNLLIQNWLMLAILAGLMFFFRRLGFFLIVEIRTGRYASSDGSMESMILWTGAFLFGPSACWLAVLWSGLSFLRRWRWDAPKVDRWNRLRNFSFYQSTVILATLIALSIYRLIGGQIPIPGLDPIYLIPAFGAVLVHFVLVFLIWLGYIAYAVWTQATLTEGHSTHPIVRFLVIALGLPMLAHPFAILLAGLYVEYGLVTFVFFVIGLLLVAVLARQLSWAAEISRQQSRQLEKLERLGRAIITAPPDASTLPDLLNEFVPTMFPSGRVAIWVEPDRLAITYPDDWSHDDERVWGWLQGQTEIQSFQARQQPPWSDQKVGLLAAEHNAIVVSPILDAESGQAIGGVYLELFSLAQPWDRRSLVSLYPAVQSLAAQVSSALHQADVYAQALGFQKISQELALAGKIQASFLPDEIPNITGWELAVTLLPARETSGDYFDLIQLSNGKLGILIADVTDKGVGAALYMALSRTLIRTYAIEFDDDPQPEVILFAANGRLLKDARADLFVTAFYGILDPETGTLTYCNAGHNPPYLVRHEHCEIESLVATGMPMGIEEDQIWGQVTVEIGTGDTLILYTDGIPDAQSLEGNFFGSDQLQEIARNSAGLPAHEVQALILDEIQDFSEDAPQFDDITLMVLVRDLQ